MSVDHRFSIDEEIINIITHGAGLALSVTGLSALLILAALRGSIWHIAGCGIFGLSLIILYTASTLYHSFKSPRAKRVLKIIDHCCIYLLIAGTYTPFTLVNLRGAWGWTLLAAVWTLALLGILFKIFFIDNFKILSTLFYLLLGWIGLLAIKPLVAMVAARGIILLMAGGFFYTTGLVFFACKKIPYNHAVWHVFVLAGSACHYFAVMFYVLP